MTIVEPDLFKIEFTGQIAQKDQEGTGPKDLRGDLCIASLR
ncbi:MAG: hypothetical protein WAW52_11665 [Methanothrix sp.]